MLTVISIIVVSLLLLGVATVLTRRIKWFSEARAMTAPVFALTLIPAFYTVFGTSYQIDLMAAEGVRQWWYYAVSWYPAYVLGILLAGMIRSTGQHLTLPDRFSHHGQLSEFLASIVSFIYLMPLDVMFMLGIMIWMLTGYIAPIPLCIIIAGVAVVYFTAKFGWAGYSLPGILYFVFMAAGVGVVSLMLVTHAGGASTLLSNLDKSMLTPWFTDFNGFLQGLTDPATLIWFLMGFAFIIDPMVWQRFSLADTEKSARTGMIFAFLFWIVFDISTVWTGLAVSQLALEGEFYLDAALRVLPGIWAGLVMSGNLMAALAGGSAYLHAGGMIFAQNIAKSLGYVKWETTVGDKESKQWYEKGVYVLGTITIIITLILNFLMPDDPTTIAWLVNSGLLFGGLFFPLLVGGLFFRDKIPHRAVSTGIVFGLVTTLAFMIYGFIYPNATSILTFGITSATATGSPYIDASRILGFIASIIGTAIGGLLSIRR